MIDIQLNRYYDRYTDPNTPQHKNYKQLLFRAGDALQSAEVNEIQDIAKAHTDFLANYFLRNGEVISGCSGNVTLDATGTQNGNGDDLYDVTTTITEGIIFADTEFVHVIPGVLVVHDQYIPESEFLFGVKIKYEEVTNSSDVSLLDPAVETRNFKQPGAGRLKVTGEWILETDYQDLGNTVFFPFFSVKKGEIVSVYKKDPDEPGENPFRKDMIDIVAKYDRNANGNYLVDGYETAYLNRVEFDDGSGNLITSNLGPFRFSIADGSANINGYNYEIDVSQDLGLDSLVDFELKQDEPISFANGDGYYPTRHTPIRKVFRVSGQRQIMAQNMTHGSFINAIDELPNEYQPVRSIDEIRQGVTTYIQGTDYNLNGDSVEWIHGANQPAPSSTYEVDFKYQYTEMAGSFSEDPNNLGTFMGDMSEDLDSIYFYGFAPGTDIQYDYDFVLQRIDAIFIDATGKLGFIKGVPDENDPRVPDTDPNLTLKIAEVLLGGDFDPEVTLSSQRVFKMSDIQLLLENIKQNEYNLTRMALQMNLAEQQPGATLKGQFVDNFNDDSQRDEGLEYVEEHDNGHPRAMTIGGNLIMDIDWVNINISPVDDILDEQVTLEMPSILNPNPLLSQPHYTKWRQINEYLFKAPPGAKIRINPSVYRWITKPTYQSFVRQVQVATRGINSFKTIYHNFGTHRWHQVVRTTQTSSSTSREILGTSVSRSESIQSARVPSIIPRITVGIKSNYGAYNGSEDIKIFFDDKLADTIPADINGTLNSQFIIPAGILSGSKEVKAVGVDSEVSGTTLFRAEPLSRTTQTTVTQWWRWVVRTQTTIWREADPVAQSFVLNKTTAVDKIRIVFEELPTTDVTCVICKTSAGFPNKNKTLISKTLAPADLEDVGTVQDFIFDNKVILTKGKEYAFIIICKDAVGKVQVAELGAKTLDSPYIWLTGQAYSIGTLYNSSNNSAWTPIQTEDMRFWIYGCTFDNTFEIPFETVTVEHATDIMVLANAKVYEGAGIQYKVDLLDRVQTPTLDKEFIVNGYSQFPLIEEYNGEVQVTAMFFSNGKFTPVLDPNIQLSIGTSKRESIYITKAFPVDYHDETLVSLIDNYRPSNTAIAIQAEVIDPTDHTTKTWVDLTAAPASEPLGNEWIETKYTLALQDGGNPIMDVSQDLVRVKITMTASNDKNRAIISNLRINTSNI